MSISHLAPLWNWSKRRTWLCHPCCRHPSTGVLFGAAGISCGQAAAACGAAHQPQEPGSDLRLHSPRASSPVTLIYIAGSIDCLPLSRVLRHFSGLVSGTTMIIRELFVGTHLVKPRGRLNAVTLLIKR